MAPDTKFETKPEDNISDTQSDEGVGSEGGPTDPDEAEAFNDVQEQIAEDRTKE
jgi:hypothetical protein